VEACRVHSGGNRHDDAHLLAPHQRLWPGSNPHDVCRIWVGVRRSPGIRRRWARPRDHCEAHHRPCAPGHHVPGRSASLRSGRPPLGLLAVAAAPTRFQPPEPRPGACLGTPRPRSSFTDQPGSPVFAGKARVPRRFTPWTTIRPMTEKLPIPCEYCHATGISNGSECLECRGKGYRLIINGQVTAPRPPAAPHRPHSHAPDRYRNAQGRSRHKI